MYLCVLEKQYSVFCLVGNTSLPPSFLQPWHFRILCKSRVTVYVDWDYFGGHS